MKVEVEVAITAIKKMIVDIENEEEFDYLNVSDYAEDLCYSEPVVIMPEEIEDISVEGEFRLVK